MPTERNVNDIDRMVVRTPNGDVFPFASCGADGKLQFTSSLMRPAGSKKILTIASITQSSEFTDTTRAISIFATKAAFFSIGESPVVNGNSHYINDGERLDFVVSPGEMLGAIRALTDGAIYITELK